MAGTFVDDVRKHRVPKGFELVPREFFDGVRFVELGIIGFFGFCVAVADVNYFVVVHSVERSEVQPTFELSIENVDITACITSMYDILLRSCMVLINFSVLKSLSQYSKLRGIRFRCKAFWCQVRCKLRSKNIISLQLQLVGKNLFLQGVSIPHCYNH